MQGGAGELRLLPLGGGLGEAGGGERRLPPGLGLGLGIGLGLGSGFGFGFGFGFGLGSGLGLG